MNYGLHTVQTRHDSTKAAQKNTRKKPDKELVSTATTAFSDSEIWEKHQKKSDKKQPCDTNVWAATSESVNVRELRKTPQKHQKKTDKEQRVRY